MRKKERYTSNFALFWESFDFLNSFKFQVTMNLVVWVPIFDNPQGLSVGFFAQLTGQFRLDYGNKPLA